MPLYHMIVLCLLRLSAVFSAWIRLQRCGVIKRSVLGKRLILLYKKALMPCACMQTAQMLESYCPILPNQAVEIDQYVAAEAYPLPGDGMVDR